MLSLFYIYFLSFLSLMFWNSSLSIWLSVSKEVLIVPSLSVSVSVPVMWPTACARRMIQEHWWHDNTISLPYRRELPSRAGKLPVFIVHIPAETEEKDLVICSLTWVFYDFLVLGWFHSTRRHRGVDFTYWGFLKLMELFMCVWTRSWIMAVFMDLIQRDGIHSVCLEQKPIK